MTDNKRYTVDRNQQKVLNFIVGMEMFIIMDREKKRQLAICRDEDAANTIVDALNSVSKR